MSGRSREFFSARTMHLLDVLLVAYVVVWVVLGALIAVEVRRQADLSDRVTRIGEALTDIGASLDVLGGLPLVGGDIGEVSGRIKDAGESVRESGRDSRDSLERLGIMVGIALAALPLIVILPVHAQLRRAWRREVRAVAGALAGGDPDLDRLLARRSLATMPYERVLALGGDPWERLDDDTVRALADAELERLGLRRS